VAQLVETVLTDRDGLLGGAGVQFPRSVGLSILSASAVVIHYEKVLYQVYAPLPRYRVRISGAHALRLISRAGKAGSTVSSIICDH